MERSVFWNTLRYFKPDEFDHSDKMRLYLLRILDELREVLKKPIKIVSDFRTQEENDNLSKSVKNSAHLKGLAVDIACPDSGSRYELLEAIYKIPIFRFGINKTTIHIY